MGDRITDALTLTVLIAHATDEYKHLCLVDTHGKWKPSWIHASCALNSEAAANAMAGARSSPYNEGSWDRLEDPHATAPNNAICGKCGCYMHSRKGKGQRRRTPR